FKRRSAIDEGGRAPGAQTERPGLAGSGGTIDLQSGRHRPLWMAQGRGARGRVDRASALSHDDLFRRRASVAWFTHSAESGPGMSDEKWKKVRCGDGSVAAEQAVEADAGIRPVGVGGRSGQADDLRGIFDREAGKVAQFD